MRKVVEMHKLWLTIRPLICYAEFVGAAKALLSQSFFCLHFTLFESLLLRSYPIAEFRSEKACIFTGNIV